MSSMDVSSHTQQASIGVVVTRADGTVEPPRLQSYYHKDPIKRLLVQSALSAGLVLAPDAVWNKSTRQLLAVILRAKKG